MYQLGQGASRGFTLVELLVTISIFAFMLAIGIPNMGSWVLSNKARSASEFYVEGFSMARRQAVAHNAASRISLTPNLSSGQMDWQVDLCFSVPGSVCTPASGSWSTTAAPSANDPQGAAGFLSVFRAADALPPSEVLVPSSTPVGSSQIYYTALGWVDTNFAQRMTQFRLDPAAAYAGKIPVVALSVSLAGMATKCDPTVAVADSRACPP